MITKLKPLSNTQVCALGDFDKDGRWYPRDNIEQYFHNMLPPSKTWPLSWFQAAMTTRFANWLRRNRPQMYQMVSAADDVADIKAGRRGRHGTEQIDSKTRGYAR